MKLSVVIPCFNEGKNVITLINKFEEIINSNKNLDIEIIIVDGKSVDDTRSLLETKFLDISKNFKLILMDKRNGYGYDIIEGLKTAKGDVLSWSHGDLQTDPKDIIKAFNLYQKKYNTNNLIFIKGKRKNRKLIEAFFTFSMQIITFLILKVYLRDINAQPKLFSREFFEKHLKDNAPNDFSLDLYALYKAKKNHYKILSLPVYFLKREYGEAKGGGGSFKNRLNLIKRTFKYILKLRKNINY